ncbi:MAG: ElyC/SanA/YdcF family protein [Opitutaceae bacterium]
MLFWLKKVVGFWLMPLPVAMALMTVGTVLAFSPKRARLGRVFLIGGFLVLLVFSNRFVSRSLIRPLEMHFAPIPELSAPALVPPELAACKFVVVLGGGNGYAPGVTSNNRLSSGSLARIVEAVRILRVLPEARLVVCGPTYGPVDSHATELARTAVALGIAPDRITKLEQGRDTEEEAEAVRQTTGNAPIALVTSAWHLPRAMALFRHFGVKAVPCPTNYLSLSDGDAFVSDFFWDNGGLERSTWALRERIGYLWIWLRGKT